MDRKEYEKPKIVYQERLEAAAGACGTAPPGQTGKAPGSQCTWINS